LIQSSKMAVLTPSLAAVFFRSSTLIRFDGITKSVLAMGQDRISKDMEYNLLIFEMFCLLDGLFRDGHFKKGCREQIVGDTIEECVVMVTTEWERITGSKLSKDAYVKRAKNGLDLCTKLSKHLNLATFPTENRSLIELEALIGRLIFGDESFLRDHSVLMHYVLAFELAPALRGIFLVEEQDWDWGQIVTH